MQCLLVIDLQNDFCPGGALEVPNGDMIVPRINALMGSYDMVVLTQDWHPSGHGSFASSHQGSQPFSVVQMSYGEQILWPDHCIQGTRGADFHADLNRDAAAAIIRKGMATEIDSYSAFFENDRVTATGLEGLLRARHCTTLTLVGLATDFCVAWSALDAARLGFAVSVDLPSCRAIDLDGSLEVALEQMRDSGVVLNG